MAEFTSEDFSPIVVEDCFAESLHDESTIIKHVLLCGNQSLNGYPIPPSAFKSEEHARKIYLGKPIYLDHKAPKDRSVRDLGGVVVNVYFRDGKPYGDVDTADAPSGGTFRSLVKHSQKFKTGMGLSHVAKYEWSDRFRTSVAGVAEVDSVDAVVKPATTKSFFEQDGRKHMDLQALQTELESVRKERDAKAAAYATLEAEHNTLKAAKAEVDRNLEAVSKDKQALAEKVAGFEAEQALAARRASIESALKTAGLDVADKEVVSESFVAVLMAEKDEKQREGLIAHVAGLAKKATKSAPGSRERGAGSAPDAMSYESLMKSLNGK